MRSNGACEAAGGEAVGAGGGEAEWRGCEWRGCGEFGVAGGGAIAGGIAGRRRGAGIRGVASAREREWRGGGAGRGAGDRGGGAAAERHVPAAAQFADVGGAAGDGGGVRVREHGRADRRDGAEEHPAARAGAEQVRGGADGEPDAGALQGAGGEEQGGAVVHRDGVLRHVRAAGDPAQHFGESGVVHAVHALPGGDRSGAAGVAAELPDDDHGSDGHADVERVAAGRGDGGGGGDDNVQQHRARAEADVFGGGQLPPADDRGVPDARGRAGAGGGGGGLQEVRLQQQGRERRAGAVPGDGRVGGGLLGLHQERARARREGSDGDGPAVADGADAAGRAGRGHGGRVGAEVWGADGVRGAARGVPGDVAGVQAADARAHHRHEHRREREAMPADGDADARAAHPSRQGDEQHLHGPGRCNCGELMVVGGGVGAGCDCEGQWRNWVHVRRLGEGRWS